MGFLFYLLNSIFIPVFSFKSYTALIKPTTPIKSKKPLLRKGLSYDSDWARTSDLYPVKVALSQLSYGITICKCFWVYYCLSDKFYYITSSPIRQQLF